MLYLKFFILLFFKVSNCLKLDELVNEINSLEEGDIKNNFLSILKTLKKNEELENEFVKNLRKDLNKAKINEKNLSDQLKISQIEINSLQRSFDSATKEKDNQQKEIERLKKRSFLQKSSYVAIVLASIVVIYCISRFYYDLYLT